MLAAADYDGLLLDVYCRKGDEGYELAAITLHNGRVDLMPALSNCCIDIYTAWVELNTPSPAERRAINKARIARELAAAYGGNPAMHPA